MRLRLKRQCIIIIVAAFITSGMFSCTAQSKVGIESNNPHADSLSKPVKKKKDKTVKVVEDDYYNANFMRYENYTYVDNIKTILLHLSGWELSDPIINLKAGEQLKLSFDDFAENVKNYKYTVIHCSADWTKSDLLPSDYIDGFTDDAITSYQFSFNTIQKFIHYDLTFPTENLKITKSGNYLLKVYIEGDEENPVFTRRFMVAKSQVTLVGKIKRATVLNDMDYKQEVDFTINSGNYKIDNAYSNLKVVMIQNNRTDNAITTLKPLYVRGTELIYDFEEGNVFTGGSEFRRFDVKSLQYRSERIKSFAYDSLGNHVYLLPDERKTYKVYNSDKDINGRRLIKTEDGRNNDTEADYVWVHFTLPYDAPLIDGDLYVFGTLSEWSYPKETKMTYDNSKKAYTAAIFLKQGYYNYQYVFLKNGDTIGDETFIEGTHYETENDYTLFIYYRQPGTLYDQLIAVQKLNSLKDK